MSDSLGLESRVKADIVLSKLDTILGRKILFSLRDKDYLIIFKQDSCYREYVLKVDSVCNILAIKEIDSDVEIKKIKAKRFLSKRNRKLLKRLLEDKQTIMDAFDTSLYHTGFITSLPDDATLAEGAPSYFVMKDEKNKRYGEYRLPSITAPCPINTNVWSYVIRKLLYNIYAPPPDS